MTISEGVRPIKNKPIGKFNFENIHTNPIAYFALALVVIFIGIVVVESTGNNAASISSTSGTQEDTILADNGSIQTLSQTPSNTPTANAWNATSLSFDGDSDRVVIYDTSVNTPNIEMYNSNFTISIWLNKTGEGNPAGSEILVFQKDRILSIGYGITFGNETTGSDNRSCFNSAGTNVCSDFDLTFNQWYHVLGVFNGTSCSIYINNQLNETASCSNPSNVAGWDLTIGGTASGGRDFEGLIDEARLYNRSLSTTEISEIYNSGRAANSSLTSNDLQLWYSVNENSGTILHDLQDLQNGTIIDATYTNDNILRPLTINTDFTQSETQFTIVNENYAWNEINVSYTFTSTTETNTTSIIRTIGTIVGIIILIILTIPILRWLNLR